MALQKVATSTLILAFVVLVSFMVGQAFADVIFGDPGPNTKYGTPRHDTFYLGAGADQSWGRGSGDEINNGKGGDVSYGQAGNDTIYGDEHRDALFGNGGEDGLHGGKGADNLYGNAGNQDSLWGGYGGDFLDVGDQDSHDTVNAGGGTDTCKITKQYHYIIKYYTYDAVDRCNTLIFVAASTP